MVQVGLARPDRADHVVVLIELMEPGTALMVDDVLVNVLGERGVPVGVHLLAGGRIQRGGSVQRFGQRPMHAIGDYGLAVPVGRVGESHSAVGVPCVGHGTREQMLGGVDVRLCAVKVGEGAQRPLRDQAGPFDAVTRRGAVRLELVILLVDVAFEVQ